MNFRVIPATEQDEWNAVLTRADCFDFYHTPSYSLLDTSGESRMLVFEQNGNMIAIPLVFRDIPNTGLRDVSSVYGYTGWIRNVQGMFPEVFPALEAYFKKEKVVCAFSRIHPLIPEADWFERGEVVNLNTTLAIDLTLSPSEQWLSYSESVRRFVRHSQQIGLSVRRVTSDNDILTFASIYREAMKSHNATLFYYFPDDYFLHLVHSPDYDAFVLLAEINGAIAGGALFVVCNRFMQYHLGAVVDSYRSYSPLKRIIDEARQIGNQHRLRAFHLGGGLGGENDNLYVFKSRMASLRYTFKVWKWIVDEESYSSLSAGKPESSYFPLYRG